MFDPSIGRWLEEDPIGFDAGDPNLSRYVGNNPVNATDPSGLVDEKKFKELVGLNSPDAKLADEKEYAGKSVKGKTADGEDFEFRFVKAQNVSFPFKFSNNKMTYGAYVNIHAAVDTDKYDEIRFIQIVILSDYKNGKIDKPNEKDESLTDTRRLRAGFGVGQSDALHLGWRIDKPDDSTIPYYGYINNISPGQYLGKVGAKSSDLHDCPGNFATMRNMGKSFMTLAIGKKFGKDPVYLGGVKWGYYLDGDGKVVFDPIRPEPVENAPPEFGAAMFRWNKMKGVTKIEKITNVEFVGEVKK